MAWRRKDGSSSPKMESSSSKLPSKTAGSIRFSPSGEPHSMPLKSGDDERIRIMMMVKEGKMSIDGALQTAYGLGVASTPYEDMDELNKSHQRRRQYTKSGVHNFGVLKYSRSNISTKCVLQIDFQEQVFCLIVRGTTQEQKDFMDLKGLDSEDGSTRLSVFWNDATEFDLDVGSLEEKNKVVRLLNVILEGNSDSGVAIPGDASSLEDIKEQESRIIKEAVLEKRGHSAAFLVWSKRFVKVKHGELSYFKPGEEKNQDAALSLLQLKHGLTLVKKLDHNGFVVITDKKEYNFRIPSHVSKLQSEIEKERDDWIIAVQEGARPSRIQSVVDPGVEVTDRDIQETSLKQERYLRSVISTLQEELEQLGSILTIIDAPMKASIQVKRVREVVRSLDQEVRTGLLSWNIKARAQSMQKTLTLGQEGKRKGSVPIIQETSQSDKGGSTKSEGGDKHRHYPYTYADTHAIQATQASQPSRSDPVNGEPRKSSTARDNYLEVWQPQYNDVPTGTRDRGRSDKEVTTIEYVEKGVKVNMGDTTNAVVNNDDASQSNITMSSFLPLNEPGVKRDTYAQVNKNRDGKGGGFTDHAVVEQREEGDDKSNSNEDPPPLPPRKSSLDDKSEHSGSISGETEPLSIDHVQKPSSPQTDIIPIQPVEESPKLPVPSPPPLPGGMPPPPPPPGMGVSLPPKPSAEPNVKLKQWFWMKIPDMLVPGSVWLDAKDRADAFDLKFLESLFEVEGPKKKVEAVTQVAPVAAPKTLLDAKKAQNLGIFLSGFKIKAEDVEQKLNILNEEQGLTIEQIISIKRFQPTTEEADVYRNFQGNKDELSSVDQFMIKLCDIPNLSGRLDLLLTILEFPTLYEEIGPVVDGLLEAYRNLKNSQSFVRLLEYFLAIGNYINFGTTRGGAYGFKLTSLAKLVDVRSTDKKHNLLKYTVEQLYEKDLEALNCYSDVPALLKPVDISIKGLEGEIDVMKKDLVKVKNIVEKMKGKELTNNKADESFVLETEQFRSTYQTKLEVLEKNCNEIKELALYLKTKFGEPSSNYQEWLNSICEFFKHLERAVQEEQQKRRRSVTLPHKESISESEESEKGVGDVEEGMDANNVLSRSPGKKSIKHFWKKDTGGDQQTNIKGIYGGVRLPQVEAMKGNAGFQKVAGSEQRETEAGRLEPNEASTQIARSGFLEKRSGTKSKGAKWEKRYFEISPNGYLYHYKKQDGKCSGSTYLRGCTVKRSEEECVISIESEEKTFQLKAANELEAMDWFNTLNFHSSR